MGRAQNRNLINDEWGKLMGSLGTTGKSRYVSSGSTGTASSGGLNPRAPITTLALAIAASTASVGDVIALMPGHAETITSAAGSGVTKAGLTIIGQGVGNNRPTFTLGTSTAATFAITSDNTFISGVRFVGNVDSLVKMIDVSAENVTFVDCEFIGQSAKEVLSFVNIATTKDNITLIGCKFVQPTDPAGTNGGANTGAIYCVDTERVRVEGCTFDGFFETACLHNKTTAMKYLTWVGNTVNQQLADAQRVLLVAGHVGCSLGFDTDYVPGLGYPARRAAAVVPATATTTYFNVNAQAASGVLLTQFGGVCTTVFSGTATNLKFTAIGTTIATGVDICANLAVASKAAGSHFAITGTLATALGNGEALIGATTPIRIPGGTIVCTTSATNTGAAKWDLYWQPIDTSLGVPNVVAA